MHIYHGVFGLFVWVSLSVPRHGTSDESFCFPSVFGVEDLQTSYKAARKGMGFYGMGSDLVSLSWVCPSG